MEITNEHLIAVGKAASMLSYKIAYYEGSESVRQEWCSIWEKLKELETLLTGVIHGNNQ